MALALPPRDVPPERLFRLLLRRPRPVLALSFRLPCAPDLALSVQGLTALEDAEVVDVDSDLPEEVRRGEVARRVIAACLLADGLPAFASAADVGALDETETDALMAAVAPAFGTVSPLRRRVDSDAWHERLKIGARHPTNMSTAGQIFMSTETLLARTMVVHESAPDRYFGMPLCELTDGHLMAYHAAKAIFDKD